MRITCPNCNAQYEVGDEMIPSEGRDVQCSNCGTTWFQEGRARVATAVEDRAIRRPGRDLPDEPVATDDDLAEDDAAETHPQAGTSDEPKTPAEAPQRRPAMDDETREVLRQEREREDQLRAETMSDGLPDDEEDQDPRQQAAAERARMATAATLARARDAAGPSMPAHDEGDLDDGEDEVSNAIAATLREASETEDEPEDQTVYPAARSGAIPSATRSARRELLPDIEEINSSLRPDERAAEAEADADGEAEDSPEAVRRTSGFRVGFLLIAALAVIAVGVYVFAGPIAEAVPQISSMLARYVAWVDTQRVALAAAAEALTARLSPED